MAEITLEGVSKRFPGGTEAVRDLDLTIRDGEVFILVGPSGCGKSTILNMIVGLEEPSEGEIRVDGEPMRGLDPKDRNMAMVFQSYAIYPHMTVRENMAFPLRLAKVESEERERRVGEAAEILELGELLDRKPEALSGGQRQRVAMGRAMVREPVAFLLDEPLSNLDAKLRAQMRTEIARLQRRLGTTMVYVTHDQAEAMTLGDHIAVLRKGRLQQVGTPRELYTEPRNLFVAGFIGSPPTNLLPARAEGGTLVLPMAEVRLPERLRQSVSEEGGVYIAGIRP
ncbi:MAG: ABC transporter ATP-binding protein, partial [Gemmatimonadota bacterium]